MWAMCLVYHPDSDIFEQALDQKIAWVTTTYLKEKVFDWDAVLAGPIRVFSHVTMTTDERMYHDAVMLYEESLHDAKQLGPKEKTAFIKSMGSVSAEIEKLKSKHIKSKGYELAAGDTQSGWIMRKKQK